MDTLISNVTAVTMNEKMEVLFGAYIGIEDGKIVSISKAAPAEQPATIIDGTGMVAIPGLVNCHTHLATTVLRSFLDDLSVQQALEAQLQKEARMDTRAAKAAATLGIAKCLRFGITSVSDLYYYPEATAQAVADAGIKANLALSSYRFRPLFPGVKNGWSCQYAPGTPGKSAGAAPPPSSPSGPGHKSPGPPLSGALLHWMSSPRWHF